jgi:D-glycero-alpha-D-manno-heptose-7-phosphate kinase
MIISRTPFRISFFGGGTDYPAWYRKHSGAVLATTIDKYCYITCRHLPPFFEHKYCVIYSKMEYCRALDEIGHPAVREVLRFLQYDRGVEIHHDGDLPARGGMGSSSAFTVGLLHALYALKGIMPSKKKLASESIHIEQEILKETVGSQDQALAAYGGLSHITFLPNGEISVVPVTISPERMNELNSHLMLFYTGIKRTASDVAQSYVNGIESKKRQLRLQKDLVDEGIAILASGQDINGFGELLYEAWQAKRSLSALVSNTEVDDLFETALAAGAVGGKLTGAGGGGFLLLFVPPSKQKALREKLRKLIHVPFRFEFTGSQIIFCDHEQEYLEAEGERHDQNIASFRELICQSAPKEGQDEGEAMVPNSTVSGGIR